MQRKNRDIVIFNLSAIDLFCSGMGAVMVLMVLLMPYYMRPDAKPMADQIAKMEAEMESRQKETEALKAQNESLQKDNSAARDQLAKPFLAVAISWDVSNVDIDLHVVDPQGRRFYFGKKSNAGSKAVMEVDSTKGPGNELWLHPEAGPGAYQIYYHYYSGEAPAVPVRGMAVYHGGRMPLSASPVNLSLQSRGAPVKICDLLVASDGRLTVR